MNMNEELLQRCFDMDLNDEEMKKLFLELSKDKDLRKAFRSLQQLQSDLKKVAFPEIPTSLDERIKFIGKGSHLHLAPTASLLKNILRKKISLPIAAMITFFFVLGTYFSVSNYAQSKQKMEYVYVVQLPPVVIQSTYSN